MVFALGAVIAASGSSHAGDAARTPSKLDYVVLASFVHNPHLLTMASYRSTARVPVPGATAAGLPRAVPPAPEVARP